MAALLLLHLGAAGISELDWTRLASKGMIKTNSDKADLYIGY